MWYRQLKQGQDKRASKKGIATWQYLFGSIIFVVGKSPIDIMEPFLL